MDFEAHDRAIISDLEADLAAARAEIERLTKERDHYADLYNQECDTYSKMCVALEKAEAEIYRLGRELNLAKYGEPDFSWSIHKEAMSELLARAEKAEAERDEATDTIEWLNSNNLTLCAELAGWKQSARQMEAERDEARAQVAAAYETAAKTCSLAATNYLGKGSDTDLGSRSRAICDVAFRIRRLTPAHAQAALEAYGREKVREGMRRAADIAAFHVIYDDTPAHSVRDGIEAEILAEMEKFK